MAEGEKNVNEESMSLAEDAQSRHVHKIDGKSIDDYTKVSVIKTAETIFHWL